MSSIVLNILSPLTGALVVTVLDCIEIYRVGNVSPDERRKKMIWSIGRAIVAALIVSAVRIFIS